MRKILPFISIVIVNYNGKDIMGNCISSLKKADYPSKKFEIIVVDNNSTDGSVEYISRRFPDVKFLVNKENLGYTGINPAIPLCKGEFIYFINNDITLNKSCLKNLVETMEKDRSIARSTLIWGHMAIQINVLRALP